MSAEMTREQARDTLRNAAWLGTDEDRERIERAVELLCGEPCEDAISRQAAITALKKHFSDGSGIDTECGAYWNHVHVIDVLQGMRSVTPRPKTGHWIKRPHGFQCSKCLIVHSGTSIFCPSCGTKMVEPQESGNNCHTCKHYTSGETDGSCGSYICKGYSNWESEGEGMTTDDMAIKALEQINKIKAIIESPIYVQEDVFRYKAICEVFKSEEQA